MKPTNEQQTAIDLVALNPDDDLKIEAFAGAGKTTTLNGIAKARTGRGLYLAFNRAIKDEATAKFPGSVQCKTAHGLAYGPVGSKYRDRLKGRITPRLLEERYNLQTVGKVGPRGVAILALRTIAQFCQSGDGELMLPHFPTAATKDPEVLNAVSEVAKRLWQDMVNLNSDLPVTHDFYLKKWAMTGPRIGADYILFDEAQDANGVMLSIVMPQAAQKIFVGDRYQQIYSWRGAINAMQVIPTARSCQITQSFRFGTPIAEVANDILNGFLNAGVDIKGYDVIPSRIDEIDGHPDAYLFRTNGALIGRLVDLLDADRSPVVAVTSGTRDLITLMDGAEQLKDGQRCYLPELAAFETWAELCEYAESEIGGDLAPLVKLMDRDVREIRRALERTQYVREQDAEVTLSTAHKSKGREWGSVKLANDFQEPDEDNTEEANLLYVAATRARNVLDISDCSVLTD